jgi:hypothetical protein
MLFFHAILIGRKAHTVEIVLRIGVSLLQSSWRWELVNLGLALRATL